MENEFAKILLLSSLHAARLQSISNVAPLVFPWTLFICIFYTNLWEAYLLASLSGNKYTPLPTTVHTAVLFFPPLLMAESDAFWEEARGLDVGQADSWQRLSNMEARSSADSQYKSPACLANPCSLTIWFQNRHPLCHRGSPGCKAAVSTGMYPACRWPTPSPPPPPR